MRAITMKLGTWGGHATHCTGPYHSAGRGTAPRFVIQKVSHLGSGFTDELAKSWMTYAEVIILCCLGGGDHPLFSLGWVAALNMLLSLRCGACHILDITQKKSGG